MHTVVSYTSLRPTLKSRLGISSHSIKKCGFYLTGALVTSKPLKKTKRKSLDSGGVFNKIYLSLSSFTKMRFTLLKTKLHCFLFLWCAVEWRLSI